MPKYKKAKYWESGAYEYECPHCKIGFTEEGFAEPEHQEVYECENCEKPFVLKDKAEN